MGRGRAKAKQTKVARDLKYRTWETDLDALKKELSNESSGESGPRPSGEYEADDDYDDYNDSRR